MHDEAVRLGRAILYKEEDLDNTFKKDEVDSNKLKTLVMEIARLRGELRVVHLLAHLEMKRVLLKSMMNYGGTGPADRWTNIITMRARNHRACAAVFSYSCLNISAGFILAVRLPMT